MENFRITNRNHKSLDGVRAIGILMVILKHYYGEFISLSFFSSSIDLLFCLSGLLISGILIETKEKPNYFKNFYIRRALRIFPLYYLLLLLFLFFIYFITSKPESLKYFTENIYYFLFYAQNWYFIIYGIPDAGHLNHTWSLAVDEQIYILWPFLIFICKNKKNLIWLCLSTIVFSLVFRIWYINLYLNASPLNPYAFFHNTFCRIDSFAAGSLLYCLLRFDSKYLNKINCIVLFVTTGLLIILIGIVDKSFEFSGYLMSNFGITLVGLNFSALIYFSLKSNSSIIKMFFQI